MNDKQQGVLREFLAAASAALIAYGFGTETLWQEAIGGIVAAVALGWGIMHNDGAEAWFSLARKVLSSVAGVLVLTGSLQPDKADALLGAVLGLLSMGWSVFGKGNTTLPPAVGLFLLASLCLFTPSCETFPVVSVITPWGSGSKDADGNITVDTIYASGSKSGLTGEVTIYPKAPIVIPTK